MAGTGVIPGYPYPSVNPQRGTLRLDLFNAQDLLTITPTVKDALAKDPRWERSFDLPPYAIFHRKGADPHYVRVPRAIQRKISRRALFARDGWRCVYCGSSNGRLTLDHVVPRSKGGESVWENVVTACAPCNLRKGDRSLEQVGMELKTGSTITFNMHYYKQPGEGTGYWNQAEVGFYFAKGPIKYKVRSKSIGLR